MADQKPKIEFQSNIPKVLLLVKQPPKFKGEHDGNAWWGWEVKENGEEKTLFANSMLQEQIEHLVGKQVRITYAEKRNPETDRKYHTWEVREVLFDDHGSFVQPEPNLSTDDEARKKFRDDRKRLFKESLLDAFAIATDFNHYLADNEYPATYQLNREDIRAIAIHFGIGFERKTS